MNFRSPYCWKNYFRHYHSVHWGINPPLSCQASLLKLTNCPSLPFLGDPPYILVFHALPPPTKKKNLRSFSEKVTKFLGKNFPV